MHLLPHSTNPDAVRSTSPKLRPNSISQTKGALQQHPDHYFCTQRNFFNIRDPTAKLTQTQSHGHCQPNVSTRNKVQTTTMLPHSTNIFAVRNPNAAFWQRWSPDTPTASDESADHDGSTWLTQVPSETQTNLRPMVCHTQQNCSTKTQT